MAAVSAVMCMLYFYLLKFAHVAAEAIHFVVREALSEQATVEALDLLSAAVVSVKDGTLIPHAALLGACAAYLARRLLLGQGSPLGLWPHGRGDGNGRGRCVTHHIVFSRLSRSGTMCCRTEWRGEKRGIIAHGRPRTSTTRTRQRGRPCL